MKFQINNLSILILSEKAKLSMDLYIYFNYLVFAEFSVLVLELLGLSHVWKNAGNSVEDLVIHVPLSTAWSRGLSLFLWLRVLMRGLLLLLEGAVTKWINLSSYFSLFNGTTNFSIRKFFRLDKTFVFALMNKVKMVFTPAVGYFRSLNRHRRRHAAKNGTFHRLGKIHEVIELRWQWKTSTKDGQTG